MHETFYIYRRIEWDYDDVSYEQFFMNPQKFTEDEWANIYEDARGKKVEIGRDSIGRRRTKYFENTREQINEILKEKGFTPFEVIDC